MRKSLLVLLLFTSSIYSIAQGLTLEQQKSELEAHPQEDTFRVNRMIELSFFKDLDFSVRKEMAGEALTLSRKIGYTHGEGIGLTNLGYLTYRLGNKKTGDSLIREAQAFAKKRDDAELNGVILYRLALIIQIETGGKSALDALLKAEEMFE